MIDGGKVFERSKNQSGVGTSQTLLVRLCILRAEDFLAMTVYIS